MPVVRGSERYSCQVLCMNRKIIMIRPKTCLANDGNYREPRWFTAWKQKDQMVEFRLPPTIADDISQNTAPFELYSSVAPHSLLALNGVEVFMNASGSHHQLRNVDVRMDALKGATKSRGGLYIYSNQQGCDGGRLYYDGCCCVVMNGDVVAQGSQFSLKDVEVVVAHVDLDAVASLRLSSSSFQEQASSKTTVPSVIAPYKLCRSFNLEEPISHPLKIKYHEPEEEIAFGPACWLWDYLRRSGASGFLVPLSGGADSSSVAAIVGCMCQLVKLRNGNEQVKTDALRIGQYPNGQYPTDGMEFAERIFFQKPQDHDPKCLQAKSGHGISMFTLTGKRPRYKVNGGSNAENLGLHNIQARTRMVFAFMLASLMPWVRNKSGFYLVLATSNVDEALRGNLTKYDCSSGDLNPIGSINKTDLRAFLRWAAVHLGYSSLAAVEAAPPTGELEPARCDCTQDLCFKWGSKLTPSEIGEKVKHFFNYSPEDNRFDLRQFLYNSTWPFQFRKIDELVKEASCNKADLSRLDDRDDKHAGVISNHIGAMGIHENGN
ncbi:Glutamine-dependent NAD(+) synthetase [Bienertia sinuspersici]